MVYYYYFKRSLDIILSVAAIIVLSPVLFLTAIVIFMQDFGPVIFKQLRVGKNEKTFLMLKFRSMPVKAANVPSVEAKKIRVTFFGKIIRRTNIDELPQLFNILRGDMSIVGYRPSLPTQEHLTKLRRGNKSLYCRPGLTGLAQINSYNFMPDEEKASFDGKYAENISFLSDVKIILKTFLYLTKRPPTY